VQLVLTTSFVVPMVNASRRASDVTAAVTVLTAATSQTAVRFCNVSLCSKYKGTDGVWLLQIGVIAIPREQDGMGIKKTAKPIPVDFYTVPLTCGQLIRPQAVQ